MKNINLLNSRRWERESERHSEGKKTDTGWSVYAHQFDIYSTVLCFVFFLLHLKLIFINYIIVAVESLPHIVYKYIDSCVCVCVNKRTNENVLIRTIYKSFKWAMRSIMNLHKPNTYTTSPHVCVCVCIDDC